MKKIFNKIILILLITMFYVMFTGFVTGITIVTGVMISIVITIIVEPMIMKRKLELNDITRLFYIVKYVVKFIEVEIKEHLELTKLVLRRKIDIQPKVIEINFDLNSDYAATFLATTITNTPGTIVLHIDKNRKKLCIHWLTPKTENVDEAKKIIVNDFEHLMKKIFE